MATRSKSPPAPGRPDREQELLALQQTLAQVQASLAEALRNLSSGSASGVRLAAAADVPGPAYQHTGTLNIADGVLFLDEGSGVPDPTLTLPELARGRKRIQLTIELEEADQVRSQHDNNLFNALGAFLKLRSANAVPMKATCWTPPTP
jgi:hypothetical protein